MDKPEKLKSINNISLIWLEECSEIKYAGFKELLGCLRHPTLDLDSSISFLKKCLYAQFPFKTGFVDRITSVLSVSVTQTETQA